MATEIERKFTVTGNGYRAGAAKVLIQQGFLSLDPERVVRIRLKNSQAFLTIKGKNKGITRAEFEYEIPEADARMILENLCHKPLISKWRYVVPYRGLTWEVDEFMGENEGLVIAEVELPYEKFPVQLPEWIDKEVSDDPQYYNSNLAVKPYQSW